MLEKKGTHDKDMDHLQKIIARKNDYLWYRLKKDDVIRVAAASFSSLTSFDNSFLFFFFACDVINQNSQESRSYYAFKNWNMKKFSDSIYAISD